MKKILFGVLVIVVLLIVWKSWQSPIVSGYVTYEVSVDGTYPQKVSAFGALKLQENSQPKDMVQVFKFDLLESGLLSMEEGLMGKNGTISLMPSKTLKIVTAGRNGLTAENGMWTVKITPDSVSVADKDGKGGSLVSGWPYGAELGLSKR